MIEKRILSVLLHNPHLYKDFQRYSYYFQNEDCKYIYEIIKDVFNKNKNYNYNLVSDYNYNYNFK